MPWNSPLRVPHSLRGWQRVRVLNDGLEESTAAPLWTAPSAFRQLQPLRRHPLPGSKRKRDVFLKILDDVLDGFAFAIPEEFSPSLPVWLLSLLLEAFYDLRWGFIPEWLLSLDPPDFVETLPCVLLCPLPGVLL